MEDRAFSDLMYGDNGKGTMVDYDTRVNGVTAVVRTSGGSQPAHHVETPEGIHHNFRQIGSGGLVDGVKTFLTKHVLINPFNMLIEAQKLEACGMNNVLSRVIVSENCLVITPFHVVINKVLEISRGDGRHGSVGMGVGQTIADFRKKPEMAIFARDLKENGNLHFKLMNVWFEKKAHAEMIAQDHPQNWFICDRLDKLRSMNVDDFVECYVDFAYNSGINIVSDATMDDMISQETRIVFEPTQGILLDPQYGFHPHVTKTQTTAHLPREMHSRLGRTGNLRVTGITRAYATRHGRGPFVTEDIALNGCISDKNNIPNDWQESMRYGWLDLVAMRYAIMVNGGVDDVAVTCLDQLNGFSEVRACNSYEYLGNERAYLDDFFEWEEINGRRIKITRFKLHDTNNDMSKLTRILCECIPLDWALFSGWDGASRDHVPINLMKYLDFLSSEKGLNVPIKTISVGPTWRDKIDRPTP